jgi:hypothetical protein
MIEEFVKALIEDVIESIAMMGVGEAVAEELPFTLVLDPGDGSEPVRVYGEIDRIDRLPGGGLEVVDYKTGKVSSQKDVSESLQLAIYALACRDALGLGTPERVTLYFTESATRLSTTRSDEQLDAAALRVEVTIREGWEPSRWGRRTTVSVGNARHSDRELRLAGQWQLEVRGALSGRDMLPPPGSVVAALATIRGDDARPMLVVDSPRLLDTMSPPRGLAALRDRLASAVLRAAGTDLHRIRAAEMAAALALGRRDLLARERKVELPSETEEGLRELVYKKRYANLEE